MEGSAKRGRINENDGIATSASYSHPSTEGGGTALSSGYDYEVFLSFRGSDIRSGFTDFLYTSLTDAGIRTFKDDEELRIGEEFAPELLQAIKQSKISIPIFSKGYASSAWCLKEVVQMVECQKTKQQKIMPIFYDVAPSEVRHQTGDYGEAFLSHENNKRYDEKTMREWKAALGKVSFLNGWDLHNMPNRREGQFARELTQKILTELKKAYSVESNYSVGVDNHVDDSYELTSMDHDQSLQLFSKHAFRRDSPLDEYIDQSNKVIDIAKGLPLALEVIGSLLSHTEKRRWNDILEKLENAPHTDVRHNLKISYDALKVQHRYIFLDIACLFIGSNKDVVVHFWEKSKFFPKEAMEVLQNMCLIKIGKDNKVWMHDQLRDLGRDIVREESNMKIEMQSRLWNPEEALELLSTHKIKTKVEALRLKSDHQRQYCFTFEDFKRLPNLRFLEVDGWTENLHFKRRRHSLKTNVFQKNSDLLPQLKWLSWRDIPPTFDITNFFMENIVIVDLSFGKFTHDWDGWSHMQVIKNLKVLNLNNCWYLERTPNLSAHANLECTELVEIDRSICQLKQLGSLDVTHCSNLRRLPDEIGELEALKELQIDWTPIKEIPNCWGMRNLRIFTASGCGITMLPLSIGDLASLRYVSLKGCRWLEGLPDSIGCCESLIELDISLTKIKELPDSLQRLKNLKLLKMTGSCISNIPDTLWTLEKLEEITAADNRCLHLKIGNCIYRNQSLRILRLKCAKICTIPRLPESLTNLYLSKLDMMTFPDLSNLINLKQLDLRFGPRHHDVKSYGLVGDLMPWWIGKLSKLQFLGLECDYVIALPTDIILLPQLKTLDLHCSNLSCLPRLPSSLSSLSVNDCTSLSLMDLSNLKKLSSLTICSSPISEMRDLGCLWNLKNLRISDHGQVEILPDFSDLNKLRSLEVRICGKLVEIQGELPQSLEKLEICSCESLEKLPDLSSLKRLQKIVMEDCMKLNVEAILGIAQRSQANLWQNLQNLQISDLQQVEKLPDLSNLNKVSSLDVRSCGNLVEIQGKLPQSLEELRINSCESSTLISR